MHKTDPEDRTIIAWNDRRIVVHHVTTPDAEELAKAVAREIGGHEVRDWIVCDGHLPVQVNEGKLPRA